MKFTIMKGHPNEEFTIHPKTVKVKCLRKIYYLWIPTSNSNVPGEEEVTNLVDVFHGCFKHTSRME